MPWLFLQTRPCLGPSGETLGSTCPKRSPGNNLGQKTLCQAIAFSHVKISVCWRNLSMAILSLLWQKVSRCLGLVEGRLCSHLACPLGQSSWTFSLSHQTCTWYPTDLQRNWKELVGGSPVGKGCSISGVGFSGFSMPIFGVPICCSAGKGGGCGAEGFLLST